MLLAGALCRRSQYGCFLGRKGDGDPGVKTIGQGIQDVRVAALTIQALRDEAGCLGCKPPASRAKRNLGIE
jgi:hypothetical protein